MNPNRRKLLLVLSIGVAFLSSFINAKAQICSVNAGIDKSICITQQPLLLSGTTGMSQASPPEYLWTKLSGPSATITNPVALATNVNGLTPGNYVFQLSNKCIDGLYARDIVSITVLPEPPTPLAGNDITVCSNQPVHLSANAVSAPNTGTWTVTPSIGTFSPNANDPNAVYTGPTRVGGRKLTWTVSNGACEKSDIMFITYLEPALPVTAGPDTILTCKGKCVVLKGSYPGYVPQHGLWTVISGPNIPTFSDPANFSAKVCNLIPGIYRLRWTVSGPCVNDSDEVVINVQNTNMPPISLGDQVYNEFCETPGVSSEVLMGAPLAAGDTVTWTQIGGGSVATFSPDNHHSTVTVNNLTGTFPYKFLYTHTSASGCTIVTTHTVYRSQLITGLTDPPDQALPCDVTATTFDISYNKLNTAGNNIIKRAIFISGPIDSGRIELASSVITGATRTDTWNVSNLLAAGTYIYRLEYSNPCGASYQEISFVVSRTPGTVNAGSDIVLPCHELAITPIGAVNSPGIYSWSQISGPGIANIASANTLTPSVEGLTQGIYTMRLSNWGGNACPVKTDDMNITVTQLPPPVAITAADTSICAGNYHLTANTPGITETGSWSVFPVAGISFSPGEYSPNAYASGLEPNSSYYFTWTVSNACGNISATQHITTGSFVSSPVPDAGEDFCAIQGTNSITLSGNDPMGANILWTSLTPGATISSSQQQNTEAFFTGAGGQYFFEYALGVAGCGILRDTMCVTIKSNIQVSAGPDIQVCAPGFPYSTMISGSVSSRSYNPSVHWSQVSGPGAATIVSANDLQTMIQNLQEGNYEFEIRSLPSNECEYIADTVKIIVSRQPSDAVAGPNQSICDATIHTIVQLAANTPVIGTGHWQIMGSPAGSPAPVFSDPSSPVSTVTNLIQGVYRLRWSIINGLFCDVKTDDVNINVSVVANAGGNISLCSASSIQLTGNANTNGTWTIVSGFPGTTIAPNSGNGAIASGMLAAQVPLQYIFRYSLPGIGACRGSYDDVVLTNHPMPSAAIAGGDKILCFDEATVTLTGNIPLSGRGSWQLQGGPNLPVAGIANNISYDTILNNLVPGIYTFQYRVSTNAVCPVSTDNMQVIKLPQANAQADTRLCNASAVNLNAVAPLMGQGTWSYLSGPASPAAIIFSNIHNPASAVTGLMPGIFIFRWTVDSVGLCGRNYDDVKVTIDPPVVALNPGSNRNFCEATTTPFLIGSPGSTGISYNWTPVAMLNNPNIAQPVFQGVNNAGNYVYTVRASAGTCEAYSSVSIAVKPRPFANIEVLNGSCTGSFMASFPGNAVSNPLYEWDFGYSSNPSSALGMGPHVVTFNNSGTRTISLNITSADGCSNSNAIQFFPYCVLPVKLISFDALWKTSYADLQWQIEDEFSQGYFELERSFDGITFNFINKVQSIPGNKKYDYSDKDIPPYHAELFYRLKMVDADRNFIYSPVRKINLKQETLTDIKVWPNPFSDKISFSYRPQTLFPNLMCRIYDASGNLILSRSPDPRLNGGVIEIKNLKDLPPGFYNLQLVSGNKIMGNYKIIKNIF